MARRRGEDGAVVPMVAIFMTLLVTMAAFAVDLGMQRVARRDMQALADVIALDMVRQVDGRSHAVIKAASTWQTGLRQSLYNNLRSEGVTYAQVSVQQQQELLVGTVAGDPLRVTVSMGELDESGTFAVDPYPAIPSAVQVVASTSVDFAFAPGSGGASRTAVAETEANSCFSVGSFVAGLSTSAGTLTSLLNPILGDTSLTAVSYQGLANASVSLLDLVEAPSIDVGTLDGLLDADGITVADLMLATIEALQDQGDASSLAAVDVLDGLVATTVVGNVALDVADLIDLTTAGEGALDARLNVLDLIAGAVTVANGTHFVGAPSLDLAVPNLLSTTQSVSILEAPHLACGGDGAEARTAQVQVSASGTVGSTVTIPLGGSVSIGGPLALSANLGSATGTLGAVSCDPDVIPISVDTALSSLNQSLTLGVTGNDIGLGTNVAGVPGVLTADISYSQVVSSTLGKAAATDQVLTWDIPTTDTYATTKQTAATSSALPAATVFAPGSLSITDIKVAGVPVASIPLIGALVRNTLINTATTLVNTLIGSTGVIGTAVTGLVSTTVTPLISRLNTVVSGLAGALGLDIAGADVSVLPYAVCNSPVLRG